MKKPVWVRWDCWHSLTRWHLLRNGKTACGREVGWTRFRFRPEPDDWADACVRCLNALNR